MGVQRCGHDAVVASRTSPYKVLGGILIGFAAIWKEEMVAAKAGRQPAPRCRPTFGRDTRRRRQASRAVRTQSWPDWIDGSRRHKLTIRLSESRCETRRRVPIFRRADARWRRRTEQSRRGRTDPWRSLAVVHLRSYFGASCWRAAQAMGKAARAHPAHRSFHPSSRRTARQVGIHSALCAHYAKTRLNIFTLAALVQKTPWR